MKEIELQHAIEEEQALVRWLKWISFGMVAATAIVGAILYFLR